ncbi:MAG: hypothetical protein HRU30_05550 [Rhodobacteraceae bacterium]|nr:hypothetical protein [Paracoccaceae bacterium]
MVAGKLMLGALGASLLAKAAVSVPDMSIFTGSTAAEPAQIILAAGEDDSKKPAAEPEENVPELVTDLPEPKVDENAIVPEELLRSIRVERDLLAEQKRRIDLDRAEVALAREALTIEKDSLTELRDEIGNLLDRMEAAKTDDLDRLIAFYSSMKPADAARIMDDLDIETTVMVMGTMKPRSAAPILAKMAPVRARAVSKIILERSQLPADQDLVGIKLK